METTTTPTVKQDIYFYVPYNEKDYVKSLGCRWDVQRKKWYINAEHINKKTMCFYYRVILS